MAESMQVLVTGGAGFIGANLSRTLIERGHRVTVLDDLSTGSLDNLEGVDVEFFTRPTKSDTGKVIAADWADITFRITVFLFCSLVRAISFRNQHAKHS